MMQVAGNVLSKHSYIAPSTAPATVAAPAEAAEQGTVEPEVKVSLSAVGLARSKEGDSKNADIEDSNLPDEIKQLLKMIRKLKAQLAEKMAELQALTARGDMGDEAQRATVRALQSEVASISGALSTANVQLVKVMHDQKLSSEQSATVASLMAR